MKNSFVTQDVLLGEQQLTTTLFRDLKDLFCQDYSLTNYGTRDITETTNLESTLAATTQSEGMVIGSL